MEKQISSNQKALFSSGVKELVLRTTRGLSVHMPEPLYSSFPYSCLMNPDPAARYQLAVAEKVSRTQNRKRRQPFSLEASISSIIKGWHLDKQQLGLAHIRPERKDVHERVTQNVTRVKNNPLTGQKVTNCCLVQFNPIKNVQNNLSVCFLFFFVQRKYFWSYFIGETSGRSFFDSKFGYSEPNCISSVLYTV